MASNKQHNLSIFLIKDSFSDFEQVIETDHLSKKIDIKDNLRKVGTLYYKSSFPTPPKWSSFFDKHIDIEDLGKNTTVSAVLLIKSIGKIFALTFGQGRFLLKPDCWVERFGLKVALNSIGSEKIRTIDKKTFDAISRQSIEQASQETEASNFGLDIEQDLLRAVTGTPKDSHIGKRIYGMDSLSVSTNIKIDKLEFWLQKIYDKYTDNSYKKDFPWVDHISEVKDKTLKDELDKLLFSQIASGNTDRVWMSVPEIIEWEKVGGFCFKLSKNSPESQDIHLHDFLDSLSESEKNNIEKSTFTNKYVHCIDSEGIRIHRWQAYKCLYCELEKENENETYLLSEGKWYIVENDFVSSVKKSFSEIPNYKRKLPTYNDDSEEKYNKRVSDENPDLALMDQKIILHGGGYSKIEFCDLFSFNGDIIHVKRYGASSVLSHLFAQGRVSGDLFQMDKEFRVKVSKKLPEGFKIRNIHDRPQNDSYQVVYAIISEAPGELDIPFFSRLNLKNSARNLLGLGYRVAKLKIDVEPEKAKLKKYRPKRK